MKGDLRQPANAERREAVGVLQVGGFGETVLDALEVRDRRVCVHVKIDDLPVPVSKLDLIAVRERFVASERVCPGQMIVREGQNRDVDVLIHDAHDTRLGGLR